MLKKILPCLVFLVSIHTIKAQSFTEEKVMLPTDNGELGGILMFPENTRKVPVVLIIQGSGPTDKDGNSAVLPGKNNSLRLLAESLAKAGIASLRFDKRGLGLSQSAGKAESELTFDDFIQDARSWLAFLKADKRFKRIGVAGHSQGSLIGMQVAMDKRVSAFASIAGPSLSIGETLMTQIKSNPYNPPNVIQEAQEIIDTLEGGELVEEVPSYLQTIFRSSIQPFMISWMKYNPVDEINRLDMPILVINGSTDLQVSVEDAQRLQISNPLAKLVIIDGMNHVLKDVSANRTENMAAYSNEELPLNAEFERSIVSFFKAYLIK